MRNGLTRCAECGTMTPNEFCSRECEDLYTYGSQEAGRSILEFSETGHISTKGRKPKKWEPPSIALPGEPVDLDNLPF